MAAQEGYAFTALADPTRRAILSILSEREAMNVGELVEEFPEITRAAVSAHLRVLRHARLVEERRKGKYRLYSLGPNQAEEVAVFLTEVYRSSLTDLKRAAERR